jgi:8-oxo-dGTP pyrophosphatase MutT (NUDIX family)
MPLPAEDARADLVALCARGLEWGVDPARFRLDPARARQAGVLVLFGVLDDRPADSPAWVARDLDVLLHRRAATMGHHAGQVAFPGGGAEASDADIRATALREAVEETGLDPSGVEILGALPPLPLPVSNNIVTPVPAWWTRTSDVAAVDHREAVEVFRLPVAELLDPANRASVVHQLGDGNARTVSTPAFTVGDTLVWGFTAIVLSRMFDELGWAVPWDHARTVTP